ncbi:nucleotidyltransferase domain-containing protein [Thermogladius sp. 4427co]|uniref:nucleotidyltransferase domain-containing protein n=1 Tax=Thermogladius sp. 4427co TaxID=3450718 RepID=UPI003F7B34BE
MREEIISVLRKLAGELGATIYLFGSYARGDHMIDSDVDIVVVSELFRDISYPDRVALVRARLPPDYGFDIIPLTPEEFEKRLGKIFFREISRYWIEIKG